MDITNYGEGYGPDATPINYVDKDGILWIYQGKGKDGSDNWMGKVIS